MFKNKAFIIIVASIFSFAILFPTAIQTVHAFDGHEHQVCHDLTSHLHKKQLDCSICDYHFTISEFTPQKPIDFLAEIEFLKTPNFYRHTASITDLTHFYLRGPPLIS